MSKRTHSRKRSHTKISPKQQPSHVFPRRYGWRTKILVGVLAFALIGGGTFAQWKAIRGEAVPAKTSALAKFFSGKNASNAIDDLPPEALHPPQAPMIAAGYNASNGGLPPGALPPGVVLPGMAMIQGGRTNAQGYGQYDGIRQQFTGYERDNETGLDYAQSRYYSPTQGRFTSVDPENASANPIDPQSWNAYAYARNNPLKYTDPDGRRFQVCDQAGKNCVNLSDEDFYKARREDERNGNTYTGNKDFYESGGVYVNGDLFYTYKQTSIDDNGGQLAYELRGRTASHGKAVGLFAAISAGGGAAIGALANAGVVSLGSALTTLGNLGRVAAPAAGGGAAVLNQLSRTDASIFQRAAQLGASAGNSFYNNLTALTQAAVEKIPGGQLDQIGRIGNSPIYGSLRSGVGIAEVNGATVVVKMANGQPQILGPLP